MQSGGAWYLSIKFYFLHLVFTLHSHSPRQSHNVHSTDRRLDLYQPNRNMRSFYKASSEYCLKSMHLTSLHISAKYVFNIDTF